MIPEAPTVRAVQILIPESELRESSKKEIKKITWLETPPLGSVGTIPVFICEKNIEFNIPSDTPGASIVGKLDTEIRRVWITYAFTFPDDELSRLIAFEKSRLNSVMAHITIPPETRASLWDSKNNYDRYVLELACDNSG